MLKKNRHRKEKTIEKPIEVLGRLAVQISDKCSWDDALKKINNARIDNANRVARSQLNEPKNEQIKNWWLFAFLIFMISATVYRIIDLFPVLMNAPDPKWIQNIVTILFKSLLNSVVFWSWVVVSHEWYASVRSTGWPTLTSVRKMLKFKESKSQCTFLAGIAILFLFWYYSTGSSVVLSVFLLFLSYSLWIFVTSAIPPQLFFLSNNRQENLILFNKLEELIFPLKAFGCFVPAIEGEISGIMIGSQEKLLAAHKLYDKIRAIANVPKYIIVDIRSINIRVIEESALIFNLSPSSEAYLLIDTIDNKSTLDAWLTKLNPDFRYRYIVAEELLSHFSSNKQHSEIEQHKNQS